MTGHLPWSGVGNAECEHFRCGTASDLCNLTLLFSPPHLCWQALWSMFGAQVVEEATKRLKALKPKKVAVSLDVSPMSLSVCVAECTVESPTVSDPYESPILHHIR